MIEERNCGEELELLDGLLLGTYQDMEVSCLVDKLAMTSVSADVDGLKEE